MTTLEDALIAQLRASRSQRLTKTFSPDEPRDDHGRWASGAAASDAIAYQGASYSIHGDKPVHGFMVAHETPSVSLPHVKSEDDIRTATQKFIEDNMAKLSEKDNYVGLWFDPERDTLDIDVSKNIADRAEALSFSRANNQIAIWDVDKGEVVNTMSDGKRPRESAGEAQKAAGKAVKVYFDPKTDPAVIAKAMWAKIQTARGNG